MTLDLSCLYIDSEEVGDLRKGLWVSGFEVK